MTKFFIYLFLMLSLLQVSIGQANTSNSNVVQLSLAKSNIQLQSYCSSGCISCINGNCYSCSTGYYLSYATCDSCSYDCYSCKSYSSCDICHNGYSPSSNNGYCYSTPTPESNTDNIILIIAVFLCAVSLIIWAFKRCKNSSVQSNKNEVSVPYVANQSSSNSIRHQQQAPMNPNYYQQQAPMNPNYYQEQQPQMDYNDYQQQ